MSQIQSYTKDFRVLAIKDGQYLPGLFTGYSTITGCYHVSFFNGDTGRYRAIGTILFDESEDGSAPEDALGLISTAL
jgi:hypothetical protein